MEYLRRLFIKKLGGYRNIDEALDAISDTKEKHKILTKAVKRFFNTISAEDILRVDETSGQWIFQGKPISENQKKVLISEAEEFLDTTLWEILQTDIKFQMNKRIYLESKTDMDLIAGKLGTLILDAMRTRLKSMKKGSPLFNNKEK